MDADAAIMVAFDLNSSGVAAQQGVRAKCVRGGSLVNGWTGNNEANSFTYM